MNFVDFGALPRYNDAYLPSPVRKSVGILKMQEKFGSSAPGGGGEGQPVVTRNFRSYREIEKPPFATLESPVKKTAGSSNEAPSSPTGRKDYRSLDSPRSIMFPMDSPVPSSTYKSAVPDSPVRSTFDAKAAIPRPPVLGASVGTPKSPKSPNKKQTVKKTVSFDKENAAGAGGRPHASWDYGKKKSFARPMVNFRTNRAATTIQRLVRGGMQRLRYRIAKLEWMLESRDQRTEDAKAKVRQEFEQRKATLRLKLEQESKKETRRQQQIRTTAEEAQKLVAYLRRENKRLREKNQEIQVAINDLKDQNGRLETANSVTDGTIGTLNDHTKTIEETHAKLMEVIPKYQETLGTLNDAVQLRRQYGNAEHKIRLLYVKLMGDIVDHLEGSTTEFALAEEAMQSILKLEEEELAKDRPVNPDEYLGASSSAGLGFDPSDGDEDDEDLNNYKVHTMD